MQDTGAQAPVTPDEDDARLESLGYRPQLNRVLGLFANFSVAFTYLSPMVGIFSLFVLGLGAGGQSVRRPELSGTRPLGCGGRSQRRRWAWRRRARGRRTATSAC